MSSRQAYVRVVERIEHLALPIEIIVGVELRSSWTVSSQYEQVRRIIKHAITPSMLSNYGDDTLAATVERQIKLALPGYSYFIEIGRGNLDEYVQIYQP